MKSRRSLSVVLAAFVALAVAMPMLAPGPLAKNSKLVTATMDILSPATLGGKEIKPGTYTVQADESTVTILQDGKMVAEAPAEWKDETSKSDGSKIVVQNNQIREIHFDGKMKYVEVTD